MDKKDLLAIFAKQLLGIRSQVDSMLTMIHSLLDDKDEEDIEDLTKKLPAVFGGSDPTKE